MNASEIWVDVRNVTVVKILRNRDLVGEVVERCDMRLTDADPFSF